jgi:hypothetical protein
MTDEEFDLLDELYFVYSFEHVMGELEWEIETVKRVLKVLVDKGWVNCFKNVHEVLPKEEVEFESNYNQYFYLASKAGLFAHNER